MQQSFVLSGKSVDADVDMLLHMWLNETNVYAKIYIFNLRETLMENIQCVCPFLFISFLILTATVHSLFFFPLSFSC